MEVWKDIKGYEGYYQVSSEGRVKGLGRLVKHYRGGYRLLKESILKSTLNENGYLTVGLHRGSKPKRFKVHQLVAMAFLGHTPRGQAIVVDHVNNIRTQNNKENLQLISHRENSSKDRKGGSSNFIGVYWRRNRNKWCASININGKIKHLGSFTDELEAAQAYQDALRKLS